MKHFIAICVLSTLLTGCAQKATFENLADGRCTGAQVELIDQHISGQIDSLAKRDWKRAYSFASDDFRKNIKVDQFVTIITSQYTMLINNQGYQFNKCEVTAGVIMQKVGVKSGDKLFTLTYKLSVKESVLGVESALISGIEAQLNV